MTLYRELAKVLARHGGRFMAEQVNLGEWVSQEQKEAPEEFAEDLERLGPTFVKLGQLLSTRGDLFSGDTIQALERLQDRVEPLEFEEIQGALREEFSSELETIFSYISREPLASASLGQVHRARLVTGQEVILKVQRPLVRERVQRELKVLAEVSETLDKHSSRARRYRLKEVVEELSRSLTRELDYRLELQNMIAIRGLLKDSEQIFVPEAYPQWTTSKVLVMAYVEGRKLPPEGVPGFGGAPLADELFRVYLNQVLLAGTYHADPHPGNLLYTPDGRLCLLDLGMVGNMPGSLQILLARLLMAITEQDGEAAAETALDASGRAETSDEGKFRRQITELVSNYHRLPLSQMQAGQLILDITQAAGENGILIPYELTMLAKTLMNLDEIGRRLDPRFDPTKALERHIPPILERRLKSELTPRALLDAYLEARSFLKDGPRHFNNILRELDHGTFKVKVDAVDERELLVSFQKIANRIGVCLVIGALILGASIMTVANAGGPRLFGLPAFAVVAFLLAAGGGCWMIWSIYRQDRVSSKEMNLPFRQTS